MALTVAEMLVKLEANTRDFDRGINGAARKLRSFKTIAAASLGGLAVSAGTATAGLLAVEAAAGVAGAAVGAVGAAGAAAGAGVVGGMGLATGGLIALGVTAQATTDEMKKEFKATGRVIKEEFRDATSALEAPLREAAVMARRVMITIKDDVKSIFDTFAPIMSEGVQEGGRAFARAVQELAPVIEGFAPVLDAMVGQIDNITDGFINFATAIGRVANSEGVSVVRQLGTAMRSGLTSLGQFVARVAKLGTDVLPQAIDMFGTIASAVGDFIIQIMEMDNLGSIMDTLGNALAGIVNTLADLFETLAPIMERGLKSIDNLVADVGAGIGAMADQIMAMPEGQVRSIFNAIGGAVVALGEAIGRVARQAGPVLPTLFRSLGDILVAIAPLLGTIAKVVARMAPSFTRLAQALVPVAQAFLRTLEKAMPAINAFLMQLARWIEENPKLTGQILALVAGGKLLLGGLSSLGGVVKGLQGLFSGMSSLLGGVSSAFGSLASALGISSTALFGWIAAAAAVVGAIIYLWNTNKDFRDGIKEIWQSIKKAFAEPLAEIRELVRTVTNQISAWWERNGETVTRIVSMAWDTIVDLFSNSAQALGEVLSGAFTTLEGIWNVFAGVFTGDWERVWTGVKQIFEGIWDAIFGVFRGMWNNIVDAWNNFASMARDLGGDFVDGLISGIESAVGGVVSAARDLGESAWNTISSFWETGSPSKKMIDLGGDMVRGLQIGLLEGRGVITEAVGDLMRDAPGALRSGFEKIRGAFDAISEAKDARDNLQETREELEALRKEASRLPQRIDRLQEALQDELERSRRVTAEERLKILDAQKRVNEARLREQRAFNQEFGEITAKEAQTLIDARERVREARITARFAENQSRGQITPREELNLMDKRQELADARERLNKLQELGREGTDRLRRAELKVQILEEELARTRAEARMPTEELTRAQAELKTAQDNLSRSVREANRATKAGTRASLNLRVAEQKLRQTRKEAVEPTQRARELEDKLRKAKKRSRNMSELLAEKERDVRDAMFEVMGAELSRIEAIGQVNTLNAKEKRGFKLLGDMVGFSTDQIWNMIGSEGGLRAAYENTASAEQRRIRRLQDVHDNAHDAAGAVRDLSSAMSGLGGGAGLDIDKQMANSTFSAGQMSGREMMNNPLDTKFASSFRSSVPDSVVSQYERARKKQEEFTTGGRFDYGYGGSSRPINVETSVQLDGREIARATGDALVDEIRRSGSTRFI